MGGGQAEGPERRRRERRQRPPYPTNKEVPTSDKPLDYFKDWTNFLLVTTVAALGWVATKEGVVFFSPWLRLLCIAALALSIVFAIFTLALIPLVAEQRPGGASFYAVKAEYKLLCWTCQTKIKTCCFPQHVAFLVGIVSYAIGTAWPLRC